MKPLVRAHRIIAHEDFAPTPLKHGFTTLPPAALGDARPEEDFDDVARAAGFPDQRTLTQVHGANVVRAEQVESGAEADAVVTDQPGLLVGVRTADCVPILLCDPARRVVGAVHAGWRGTAARIGPAAVTALCQAYGCAPREIWALLGPAIGPCCYEVGDEVLEALNAATPGAGAPAGLGPNGGPTANLWRANRVLLESAGLAPERILLLNLCTSCRADWFPSYRRDGKNAGRMLSFIGVGSHLVS